MRQLLQDLRSGDVVLEDVPVPVPGPAEVIIRTHHSLISAGTERMLNSFANANYLQKARQQPDRVREVLRKARTDGLSTTVSAIQNKLDERMPLGYCNAGEVLAVGADVTRVAPGDMVASNGPHAEVVRVSHNLVARIPDGVATDTAAYTVAGSVGLQGIRLLNPTLGERVAVFGLGLVGLLAAQMLRANGCRVLGFDYSAERVGVAAGFGVEAHDLSSGANPVALAAEFSEKIGVDGVLITASTSSNELIHQAAQMSRHRGRIVLTGVVGLDLDRADFYEKELEFSVSCSYGPGRYDPVYERVGVDYPVGYVRWTEQRNFGAVLEMLASGAVDVGSLTGRRFRFADAADAYRALRDVNDIGIILEYDTTPPAEELLAQRTVRIARPGRRPLSTPTVGVIGAGSFANGVLLPALNETGARLKTIVSSGGVTASATARRFGIETSSTDADSIFDDDEIDLVVVATRHNSHSQLVVRSLEAGKAVFVEKPLAIDREQLMQVIDAYAVEASRTAQGPWAMVGFNRRFAPTALAMASALGSRTGPAAITYVANVGAIPADHWVHDPTVGGGRLIGEACHFVDVARFLVGSPIVEVVARAAPQGPADIASVQLQFEDGSIATIHYLSNGSRELAKERCEVYFDGKTVQLDNFRSVRGYGVSVPRRIGERQRKGHAEQFASVVDSLRGGHVPPIPFDEVVNVTDATIAAVESIVDGSPVELTRLAVDG